MMEHAGYWVIFYSGNQKLSMMKVVNALYEPI